MRTSQILEATLEGFVLLLELVYVVIVVGLSFALVVFCCVLALGFSHFKMSFCIHFIINSSAQNPIALD